MFKKLASDALGLSDIGKIIPPSEYDMVDSDDYILNEEDEKIFFLIKSKSDEYCFTNLALIHLDGDSAMSKKRRLKRHSYKENHFKSVCLETAGTIDLDIEIKFLLGDKDFSIDVDKKQIDQLKDLYKALYKISTIQKENATFHTYSEKSIATTLESINRSRGEGFSGKDFPSLNEYIFEWQKKNYTEYITEDFGDVFSKFINN